jgi:hypothetical protein
MASFICLLQPATDLPSLPVPQRLIGRCAWGASGALSLKAIAVQRNGERMAEPGVVIVRFDNRPELTLHRLLLRDTRQRRSGDKTVKENARTNFDRISGRCSPSLASVSRARDARCRLGMATMAERLIGVDLRNGMAPGWGRFFALNERRFTLEALIILGLGFAAVTITILLLPLAIMGALCVSVLDMTHRRFLARSVAEIPS